MGRVFSGANCLSVKKQLNQTGAKSPWPHLCNVGKCIIPEEAYIKGSQKCQRSFCKISRNKQHHRKVLLSSFHLNGHTLGFHSQTEKLEPYCMREQNLILVNDIIERLR